MPQATVETTTARTTSATVPVCYLSKSGEARWSLTVGDDGVLRPSDVTKLTRYATGAAGQEISFYREEIPSIIALLTSIKEAE